MKKFIGIVMTGCCVASLAQAAEAPNTSLFFTPDNVQKVEALLLQKPIEKNANADVHLGAVFYYGPAEWVVWLQGERWTPDTRHDDIRIIDVAPELVHVQITSASGGPLRDVSLKPHQTYQLSTGRIVEGDLTMAPSDSR